MTERYEICSLLCSHDASNSCNWEHISFAQTIGFNCLKGLWSQHNPSWSWSKSRGILLWAHVHHACLSFTVSMTQLLRLHLSYDRAFQNSYTLRSSPQDWVCVWAQMIADLPCDKIQREGGRTWIWYRFVTLGSNYSIIFCLPHTHGVIPFG